ncbi:hypothetical protein [Streptomyces cinnamoneus]|uniref:DUF11 domain-containing protein n=1 Tax=Streptomyces cinnamoneus TaxID=53446 RepID=A0A918WKC7_STRCJ|nr:hypothetical protein [Streptomyces cinnamoneus]GHC59558.1 hypothetical protein GCM10010507_40530 [Streptomyces cinnamoneus]
MALATIDNRRSRRMHRWTLIAGAALMACVVPVTTAAAARPSDSDLRVARIDPDAAPPGGTTHVRGYVGNTGPERTANKFTMTITLPKDVKPEEPFFPENCFVLGSGHRVRCTYPPGLGPSRTATADIPVRLDRRVPAPGRLTGGSVSVSSIDDRNKENNRTPFEIPTDPNAIGS